MAQDKNDPKVRKQHLEKYGVQAFWCYDCKEYTLSKNLNEARVRCKVCHKTVRGTEYQDTRCVAELTQDI